MTQTPIPRPRFPARSDALSGLQAAQERAAASIRDAIRHYPGSRVACLGLNTADADLLLHLIRTAHLEITWPEGDTQP